MAGHEPAKNQTDLPPPPPPPPRTMHSVADLTTFARRTTGDVPPRRVGASSTVVRNKLYVYGGRFDIENRMASDIYVLDLKTWEWTKIEPHPDDTVPSPRYFHSADVWNNHLVIFGGMGYKDGANSYDKEDLCVYDDVRLFDLNSLRWVPPRQNAAVAEGMEHVIPGARYAHLSSVNGNRLTIIGGQDLASQWLGDVHVYDLRAQCWILKVEYPKYCGAYRSIAVSTRYRVVSPPNQSLESSGFPGVQPQFQLQNDPLQSCKPRAPLIHLPYSDVHENPDDAEIYLYSNYNFTDVKRELVTFQPTGDSGLIMHDLSDSMGGSSLPPGLRFPTGAMVGNHIVIAGTYLAHTHQSYSIWTLDLSTMRWSRLDTGSILASGSWCRARLWEEENRLLVFGNRGGSLVDDYNRRVLSWEDVAAIDLEAYGIYSPPRLQLDLTAQELGLAALEEELLADFEIICDDGRRIKCNRKILEQRWPWFERQRRLYLAGASKALENIPKTNADLPFPLPHADSDPDTIPPDPRLTPRSFYLSEPYAITLGFLQYLYSTALITPVQHAPAVLSGLLLLATTYELSHLKSLVRHAMHRMLSPQTSVGVYEMATVCDCQNLQIRALKYVMMGNKRAAKPSAEPSGRRPDSGGGGGAGPGHDHGPSGGGRPSRSSPNAPSRPDTADGGNFNAINPSPSYRRVEEDHRNKQEGHQIPPRPSRSSLRTLHSRSCSLSPIQEKFDQSNAHPFAIDRSFALETFEAPRIRGRQRIGTRRGWSSTGDANLESSRQPIDMSGTTSGLTRSKSWSRPTSYASFVGTPALTRSSSPSKFEEYDEDIPALSPTTSQLTGETSSLPTPIEAPYTATYLMEPQYEDTQSEHDHMLLNAPLEFQHFGHKPSHEDMAPRLRHSASTPTLPIRTSTWSKASQPQEFPDVKSDWDDSSDEELPTPRRRHSLVKKMKQFRLGLPKWRAGPTLGKLTEVDG